MGSSSSHPSANRASIGRILPLAVILIAATSEPAPAECVDYADFIHRIGGVATPDAAAGIAVSGAKAFVADRSSGLQVIDVTDPSNPEIVGSADTPGDAIDVVLSGDHAYVADRSGGLAVIDVSEPTNPQIAASLDIPGGAPSVAISEDHLYVAGENSGLRVIDIADPMSPQIVGHLDLQLLDRVAVSDNYAYVAGVSSGHLMVIDVSDPAAPSVAGEVDLAGVIEDLDVSGAYVYAARDYGLGLVDVSDPANPRAVGGVDTPGAHTGAVAVYGGYAFVRIEGRVKALQTIDVTNPENPTIVGTIRTNARDVAFSGTLAYVADPDYGLRVLDVTNPEGPEVTRVEVDSMEGDGYSRVVVSGDYAYVGTIWDYVVGFFDISNPRYPRVVSGIGLGFEPGLHDLSVSGPYLYIVHRTNVCGTRVEVIDVADPLRPQRMGDCCIADEGGASSRMEVLANHLLISRGFAGLATVEVSDPQNPRLFAREDTPGFAYDVAVSAPYAFVADGDGGLQVFDVSNPGDLIHVGSLETPSDAERVAVSDTLAYLGLENGDLYIIDVAIPSDPHVVGMLSTGGFIRHIVATGTVVEFLSGSGLCIVDVADPTSPRIVGTAETWGRRNYLAVTNTHAYVADGIGGLQILHRHCPPSNIPEPFSLFLPPDEAGLATPEATLTWDISFDADPFDTVQYTLYWSEDPGFDSADSVVVGPETTYTLGPSVLQRLHTYYWKVRAWDTQGFTRWSSPAEGWSFSVKESASPPEPFTLAQPPDETPMPTFEFTFFWPPPNDSDYGDVVRHTLYWSKDPDFGAADSVIVGTEGWHRLDSSLLEAGATYYWKVRAWDTYGLARWSNPPEGWSFSINEDAGPPVPFSLLSPEHRDSLSVFELSFSWQSARRENPAHTVDYLFIWSANSTGYPFEYVNVGSDTTYTFSYSNFQPGRYYYWWVQATDTNGLTRVSNPYARPFYLLERPVPEPFSLLAPANEESLATTTPTLAWEPTDSADPTDTIRYTVYWSDDPSFRSPEYMIVDEETTYTFLPSVLREGTTYYWKVRAWNTHGQMRWSDPRSGWRFYILGDPVAPEAFSLLSPAKGDSLTTGEPTLTWQTAHDPNPGDTVVYTLHWSNDSGFGSSDSVVVGEETSYTFGPSELLAGFTYHWKVRAQDTGGLVRWSDPAGGWSFHIKSAAPVDLQLSAEVSETGILLTWSIPEELVAQSCTIHRRIVGSDEWLVVATLELEQGGTVEYVDTDGEPGVAYEYEVEVVGPSGSEGRWGPVSAEFPEVELWLALSPNPGPGSLTVNFGLPRAGSALLRIYDAAGREVARRELPDLRAGNHSIPWKPGHGQSRSLTSGVYWIRLDTRHGSRTARCLVIQ